MLNTLKRLLTGTLRRQLVVGMSVVVAIMMTLFIQDLTHRQKAAVLDQQSELAVALAQSVATSSAVWVASRDVSGLQEIVNGLAHYPDLRYAIVLNTDGQVLAHTDVTRRGLYLNDLPARPLQQFIGHDEGLVDVASPITLADSHIGWVRIGLGQQAMADRLNLIARNGLFYTLAAVILSALTSLLAARYLTRRLDVIQKVADAIQAGDRQLRANLTGLDEASQLAYQFNQMLDTLVKREAEIVSSHDALSQSESRLNQVMAVTGEGIWDWDMQSNLISHNSRWCSILGLDNSYMQHQMTELSALLHKDDRNRVMASIQSCLAGKGSYSSEHRMLRADGTEIWVQDRGDVVEHDSNGRPLRMLGSITDITRRKRVDEALLRLNLELEQRIEERTAGMKAARDEAEHANAAKSEFLSRMSHELRTPLNAILGFGQMLVTDDMHPLGKLQIDNVQEILQAGNHLLELVNEVLDLTRIENGQLEMSLEAVSIEPAIQTCVAQLRPLAEARHISFTVQAGPPRALLADKLRLHEVLINLLSNAIKYNREGGDIHISCSMAGKLEQNLRIFVRDTGHGIAPAALPRLFRPFERMESAYDGIEGTGIGLALSKKLVEAMHGTIGVDSVQGEGSSFWFELPLASALPEANTDHAHEIAPCSIDSNRYRLLYVEDNPSNLLLVKKILSSREDIDMLEADSAEAGLTIALDQRPDLILLDINLPGMNGFEALLQLRENPVTRDIPVIAITANAMTRDVERGKQAGFSDYITKPIDVAGFFDLLECYLPGHTEHIT